MDVTMTELPATSPVPIHNYQTLAGAFECLVSSKGRVHAVRARVKEWPKTDVVQAGSPRVLVGPINVRRRMT